ncbi:MAG: hypothetical protein ACR2OV_12445 [Hyphomicrobiaceae bacterium]
MDSILIVLAGVLGMSIALAHGWLGETKVVCLVQGVSHSHKRVLQAVMFLSAVYWFVGGAVLAASPLYLTASGQRSSAIVVGAMYLTGALGNAWATRGHHFGWMLLLIAVVLALYGAWLVD